MVKSSTRTVLLTGANGFIASHITDLLLAKNYNVIGTVRSEEKAKPFLYSFQEKYSIAKSNLKYVIVEDIVNEDAFDDIFKSNPNITAVIHTAAFCSPGVQSNEYEDKILKPSVNGILNILNSIKNFAPQVTNVIMTSSFGAILDYSPTFLKTIHTSSTWNPMTWDHVTSDMTAYLYSKTLAEKKAREFIKSEKVNFKFATVNPPFVLGPQVFEFEVKSNLNASNGFLQRVLKLDKDLTIPLAQESHLTIDVRDTALFHILPLENENLSDSREFIVSNATTYQTIANILNKNFPELNNTIVKGDPNPDTEISLIEKYLPKYDISDIIEKIDDFQFIPLEKTVNDTFTQYFKFFPLV